MKGENDTYSRSGVVLAAAAHGLGITQGCVTRKGRKEATQEEFRKGKKGTRKR